MKRAFTSILSTDVDGTARFYEGLLGLTRTGDYGWFVLLGAEGLPAFELGILDRHHETVPADLVASGDGAMLTFVVDDVTAIHRAARAMGATILQEPTALPYGQTRLLLRDPAGTLVDVSSPTTPPR